MGVDNIASTCLVPYVGATAATFVGVFLLKWVVVRRSSYYVKVIGIWLFEKADLRCFGDEAMDVAVWLVKERSRGDYC